MNRVFVFPSILKYRYALQIVLLLILFGLRLWILDFHGLDGDDGFTFHLLHYDVMTLLDGLRTLRLDVHPPLYYLLLKGWMTIAGQSLLVLRLPNIALDMLIGVLLLRLAQRRLPGSSIWIMGIIWGFAPLLLYTNRLLRMYTLLAFFGVFALFALLEAARSGQNRWAVLCMLAALGALYTHIFGLLIILGLGAALLTQVITQKISLPRFLVTSAGLMGAVALFIPFVLPRIQRLMQGGEISGQNPQLLNSIPQIPGQILLALLTHIGVQGSLWGGLAVLLLLFSLFWILRNEPDLLPVVAFFLVVYALLALAAAGEFYRPRYLVILFPTMAFLLVAAISTLSWRPLQALLTGGVLVLSTIGIRANLEPSLTDDFRAAAHFLEERARPEDRIIIIPEWGSRALKYHYQGETEIVGFLSGVADDVDLDAVLASEVEEWERIWLIRFQYPGSDPADRLTHWFLSRAVSVTDVYPAGMYITGYDLSPTMNQLPSYARALDATFGDVLRLRGVYQPINQAPASDKHLHPPSNWIPAALYWEALDEIPDGLEIRVRMTGAYGQTWGLAFARTGDTFQRYPLNTLEEGTIYENYYDVNLNPAAPPGNYWLEVMIFDETGEALTVAGVDAETNRVLVGEVEIE